MEARRQRRQQIALDRPRARDRCAARRRRRPGPCCATCRRGSGRRRRAAAARGADVGRIRQTTIHSSVAKRSADSACRRGGAIGTRAVGQPRDRRARRRRRRRAPTAEADWRRSRLLLHRDRLEVLRDLPRDTRRARARCRRRAGDRCASARRQRAAAEPSARSSALATSAGERLPRGVVLLERLGAGRRAAPLVLFRRRHPAARLRRAALQRGPSSSRVRCSSWLSSCCSRARSPPLPVPLRACACAPRALRHRLRPCAPWRPRAPLRASARPARRLLRVGDLRLEPREPLARVADLVESDRRAAARRSRLSLGAAGVGALILRATLSSASAICCSAGAALPGLPSRSCAPVDAHARRPSCCAAEIARRPRPPPASRCAACCSASTRSASRSFSPASRRRASAAPPPSRSSRSASSATRRCACATCCDSSCRSPSARFCASGEPVLHLRLGPAQRVAPPPPPSPPRRPRRPAAPAPPPRASAASRRFTSCCAPCAPSWHPAHLAHPAHPALAACAPCCFAASSTWRRSSSCSRVSFSSCRFTSSGGQVRFGELALLAAQLFLPPRQVPESVERAVGLLAFGLRFDLRLVLVVRLLLPLQLAIEQVGQILRLAVADAAAAVRSAAATPGACGSPPAPGAARSAPPSRAEWRRRSSASAAAARRGSSPRRRRAPDRRRRPATAARRLRSLAGRRRPGGSCPMRRRGRCRAGGLLGPRLQLGLRVGDVLDVGRRLAGAGAPLEVPGRADDLLLRRDQPFELRRRWPPASRPGSAPASTPR